MMKFILALTTIYTCVLTAANLPLTFTGVITDTMCRTKLGMMKDQPDDQCIKMCTKRSYLHALFDGTSVLKLSDQKLPCAYSTTTGVPAVSLASGITCRVGSILSHSNALIISSTIIGMKGAS
jgi:hypothetical protein